MVCHKMAGIAVQTGKIGAIDLVSELKNYIMKSLKTKATKEPYLGVVHGPACGRGNFVCKKSSSGRYFK